MASDLNHRIIQCFGLGGPFRGQLAQQPCSKQGHVQPDQVAPWNVERGAGHSGRVQERGESMQGCEEEGQGPPGIEAGKGCQKQQEGLLLLHQQQKKG